MNSPFVILGGDFNIPGLTWKPNDTANPEGVLQSGIIDLAHDFHLEQMVSFPTRKDPVHGTENILDLLITTRPLAVKNVHPAPGMSDHDIVLADISIKDFPATKPPRTIFKWNSVDETVFKASAAKLNNDFFCNDPESKPIEANWAFFRDGLSGIVKKLVPIKTIKGKVRPRWLTTHLLRLTRKKEKCYARAAKTRKQADWDKFKIVRKIVDKELRRAHRSHVETVTSTDDPKKFWRYVKSQRRNNSGVQVLKVDDIEITRDTEKAEALANQFSSVFTRENNAHCCHIYLAIAFLTCPI